MLFDTYMNWLFFVLLANFTHLKFVEVHVYDFLNSSRDKRDIDVVRENHRFLWTDDDESEETW